MRVRFTGFGGQGILMLGQIFGAAAALAGKHALQTQSYGSAARGGASKSDVTVSDAPIHELEAETADLVVCMSQPAFVKYGPTVEPGGTLVYDSGLVTPAATPAARALPVPATVTAKERFGSELFANTLLLGFVSEVAEAVDPGAVMEALLARIPRKIDENRQAFELGRRLAREQLT
jgi:2-oxoglutarate ferredoxin oxidoreductase subunit gamma